MRSIAFVSVAVPTVERASSPIRCWSTMSAVVSPSRTSTSGRACAGMKPCTNALYVSLIIRWDSAAIVPNTSELLPEPDTPVNTVSSRFGMSRSTFRRLFSRAPRTWIEPQSATEPLPVAHHQPARQLVGRAPRLAALRLEQEEPVALGLLARIPIGLCRVPRSRGPARGRIDGPDERRIDQHDVARRPEPEARPAGGDDVASGDRGRLGRDHDVLAVPGIRQRD